MTAPSLADFLVARIAEDEAAAIPKTMIISGGAPAPVVPNCIGPHGTGCPEGWSLGDVGEVTAAHEAAMTAHSLTHATKAQLRMLAECEAKRRIVEEVTAGVQSDIDMGEPLSSMAAVAAERALLWLALPYADHPDYRQEWKP